MMEEKKKLLLVAEAVSKKVEQLEWKMLNRIITYGGKEAGISND